jgi:CRISPR-associated endonuclease/helicase Cas3
MKNVAEFDALLCYAVVYETCKSNKMLRGADMSGMNKSERLEEMKRLYIQRAYSDIDMAERLGVDRTLIYRDRIELTTQYPIEKDAEGRYHIPRAKLISEIKVNLHEALTLYLAARKTSRQTRFHQPHAATALEKLAATLRQPMTGKLLKAADAVLNQERDPERIKIIEVLAQAWVEQKKVKIRYQPFGMDEFRNHLIHPYLIEPSIWSDSVYVIAYSEMTERITPFKIERINSAVLSGEEFKIPDTFDDEQLLKHAWGIWVGDKWPITVKLRFNKDAARRVKESIWHPLEKVTDTEDGGCLWSADVAEWREMLPWVRGWGADCEVLGPEGLRNALKREAVKMARLYDAGTQKNIPKYFYLWAKADRTDPNQVHRLIYHLIDVGMVAKALWQDALPSQLKSQLALWLGLSVENAGWLLAFWSALHDLGKASPAFQIKIKHAPVIQELREQGFSLPEHIDKPTRHEVVTAWAIQSEKLLEESGLDSQWSQSVAQALGGHHGAWHPYNEIVNVPPSEYGGEEWTAARRALVNEIRAIFTPPACNPQLKTVEQNALLTIFSGFVSVVDWLGSDENLFPYKSEFVPLADYARTSEAQARDALRKKGWLSTLTPPAEFDFAHLFDGYSPRPTQKEVIALAGSVRLPALVIIESPTGSGKTEAALSLYALWTQSVERPGLYIAMPTTATSDQMHERVTKFLSTRHKMDITPLLVHSRALLREDETQADESDKVEEETILRQTWFLPRKKSLLAPFGVGTVDQTFLSVLQTKHFFVRLLGLSHKIVIFDEIHAYDAYMAEIFCRLLRWLREIGASVILLSATLPEASRRRFVEAYTGCEDESPRVEYPRLTVASSQGVQIHPLSKPESQPPLTLERMNRDLVSIVERVRKELQQDGCVAVICNTVRRAQDVYMALDAANQTSPFCPAENLILFHARTTQQWRDETQTRVLDAVSKQARENGKRPKRMIVVATQVIEQSLDLDFDVMLTDLAPLDLLVQRAGRLHRHPPKERAHPYKLLITAPELKGEIPYFPRTEFPYEPNFLFRTWAVLQGCDSLTLTSDAPRLIELVYGENDLSDIPPALADVMKKAKYERERTQAAAERQAGGTLISKPTSPTLLAQSNQKLMEDDDPEASRAIRALTRRDAPGVSLVCLHRVNDQICFDPEGREPVKVENPTRSQILQLARAMINVQSQPVLEHFAAQEAPKRWKKIAVLHYARLAIFENQKNKDNPNFTLRLTRALGLQINYGKSGGQDDDL